MSDSYYEIFVDREYGGFTVKKFTPNGYGKNSVLEGQVLIQFQASFETAEEAQAAYPDAAFGHEMISARNTFDHLSDEEGAY